MHCFDDQSPVTTVTETRKHGTTIFDQEPIQCFRDSVLPCSVLMLATRTLEFDRIVDAVTALALTPLGAEALSELEPSTDPKVVVALQASTSETVKFLERHPLFPLRAGEALPEALEALDDDRPAARADAAAHGRRLRRFGRPGARERRPRRRGFSDPARARRPGHRVQG